MKRGHLALFGILLLLTVLLYGSSLWDAAALTWDDDSNIFNNPFLTMHMWWGLWMDSYYGLYVPVTYSAWAALYELGGGLAWPFHIFNIVIHIINIVLVFGLLRGLARRWQLQTPLAAALAVGLFALHPLQVETVAWLSGGRDLLATLFALLTTLLYFGPRKWWGYAGASLCFLISLLCKPNVVILPLVFLLAEPALHFASIKRSSVKLAPWFLLALFAAMVTHGSQVGHFDDNIALWLRPWLMLDSYAFYVQKLVWPHPLSANYARTPATVLTDHLGLVRTLVVVAAMGFGSFFAWRRNRRYLVALLALIVLLPVSGLVPFGYQEISDVADHYMYPAMPVLAILMLLVWDRVCRNKAWVTALPLLLISGWAFATWNRLPAWHDDVAFFTDMAKSAPHSFSTAIGMSVVECQDNHNYDEGVKWTDKALSMRADDIVALANRAFCLLREEKNQDVIAMGFYLERIDRAQMAENKPTAYASLLASIGTALINTKDFYNGFQYLCEAYRVMPAEPTHARNLEIAADILKQHNIEPNCEQSDDEGDGNGDQ